MTLRLTCLGEFQITRNSEPFTAIPTDKARALLVYLAVEGRVHTRSELVQLFWPGYTAESANNNLRQSLHRLRHLLHEDEQTPLLLTTRQSVQINPAAAIGVDVTTFTGLLAECRNHAHTQLAECLACLARLRQAVDLYRGDFLSGFTVADSDPFEEWRRITQEQLHIQMIDALTQLAIAAEAAGDEAQALQDTSRLLQLEPWQEAVHRQVIRLLAQQGQRAAALAQYQRCRQVLAEELGAEPDAATTALYEQIRSGGFDQQVRRRQQIAEKETRDRRQGEPSAETSSLDSRVSLPPVRDWAEMPMVDFFVERSTEVAQLTAWLTQRAVEGVPAQLISILGMGGMGKTTLAAVVTKAVAPAFAVVIWRSLLNAPPLSELLRNWLQILSRQTLTVLPESVDEQLRLLLTYLQQARCLLVLDNVESIFVADTPAPAGTSPSQSRAGVTRPGYEGYDQLFQRLAGSDHQSCLLLTSREQPYALLRSGRQAQMTGRLQVLPLAGLDQTAGLVLLQSNGLHASTAEAAQLVENYSGNPLALQIVAATIADFFGGDVAAFQQEAGQLFDGMRLVLDQQFARLSPLEREILIWLAIEREPVTVPTLRNNFVQPVATSSLLEALQALQNRSLLEKRDTGLTLQNVIIEYTTEYLVEQVCQEIADDLVTRWQGDKVNQADNVTLSPPHLVTLSFLNRFALLKAQAKAYVRHSQSRLIVEPVVTRLRDRLGRADLAQQIRSLLARLKERPDPGERGYAAGNLLNLLIAAGVELTGYDLSALTIWQAYLRTATLYDVNFAGADLTRSEFADTFATITALTYSPDGRLLLGGTSTGDIRVWLANSLQPVGMLQGHSRIVMGLAVGSAQSQLLASCSEDGAVRLWNLAKLDDPGLILYKTTGIVCTVTNSPLADLVVSVGDDPAIQVWDAGTRRLLAILRGHTHVVTAVAFTPDGRYLTSCSGDHTVRLWDVSAIYHPAPAAPHLIDNSQVIYQWPPAAEDVAQITISPDGQWLAGVQRDGMVWRWPIAAALNSKPVQILQKQGVHHSTLRFSRDSSLLAVASLAKTIWLLDSRSGEVVQQLEGHSLLTNALTFSPDGQTLASSGSDRVLRLWELATGRSIQAVAGAARAFRDAVFAADGQTLVTCGADRTIRIWEISETPAAATGAVTITGHCRHTLQGHSSGIWTVAVDTTSQVVASAGEDCNILLWDRRTGRLLHTLQGHRYTVTALAFSPDGQTLVSASPDQTVRLWNYQSYTQLVELRDDSQSISVHEQSIWCVALSPDGATVAAGYSDGSIVLWDIRDLAHCRQISKLRKHAGWVRKVAFSPDGTLLASGSNDQTVRIWAVATGELRCECIGHTDWVMSVAFHPDGQRLASAGYDNTIRLWDVATGKPIAAPAPVTNPATNPVTDPTPMRHNKGVMAVTFHPQGHLLLSASQDERMTFWQVANQQKVQSLVAPGPYSGMKITGVTGLSAAQKAALRALGAVDEAEDDKMTSDWVTSEKVTELPSDPVTLSPSHPVTSDHRSASPLLDWAEMPMVDFFVERRAEVAQLTAWLTLPATGGVPAQLISILGMGGMGKTTLAAVVTKTVAPAFAVVIWRSLLNAPPLSELLRSWLQTLSHQTLATTPDSLDEQLRLLLTYLQQARCLLVLDNVESIFAADAPAGEGTSQRQSRAGATRPGYEDYDQLLQRLASSEHQSCLLLTSREQPYALLRSGRQAQTTGRVQVLLLTGLDQTAGQVLLASNGLMASAAEAAQLVENYSGNPLALQIVAATIADFFGGDVAAFQQEEGQIFDGMRVVLDQQFARLSPLEREILVWLAIEREPVTLPLLRSNFIQPRPEAGAPWARTAPLLEALQALQNRSLLEKRDTGLTLQNVIIEYTTEYLVQQVCQEIVEDMVTESPNHPITQSFLNRFALLKAQSKKFIRQSQARIFLQPVLDRLVATLGRAQLVARIPQLLDALRAAGGQKGYAGGNLLNLLVQMGEDLIGYDFSHLPVWQADLSGLTVVTANFTGADLGYSTFTAGITLDKIAFQPTGELWAAGLQNGVLGLWRMVEGQLTDAFQRAGNQRSPLVFSPNGALLATTTDDYGINIWSTTSGECLQTLTGQPSAVYILAFSGDGTLLASLGTDHVVYLWDLPTGRCIQRLPGYEQGADALAFSPDGQLLATGGGDGLIQLWATRSTAAAGRRVAVWQAHRQPLGALAFSPDGRWLASGSHAGEVQLWQAASSAAEPRQGRAGDEGATLPYRAGPICQGHTSIIRALLFVPTSDPATYLLASACAHSTVRIWSSTGQLRTTLLGHTNTVSSLSVSPDGQQLASAGADKQLFLWDVVTGQALNSQQAYRAALRALAFSPDGVLASGGTDQIVRLWQVERAPTAAVDHAAKEQAGSQRIGETSQLPRLLRGHTRFICSLAFSPDGQTLASGDADGTIRLWDRATGQLWQTLRDQQGSVRALAFAPTPALLGQQEALLASAGADRVIRLWSVATEQRREARCQRQLIGHEDEIPTIAFDPHGQHLISGCADGSIRIWDVHSGATIHQLTGHTAPITAVTLSPDGKTVASSCFDQTIRLWDLTTGACLYVERGAHVGTTAVAFSPDGQYLAYTGTGYALYLWSWHTYATTPLLPPAPLRGHMSDVEALVFSPTTGHLASCSAAGTIRLWDLASKRCYQILRAPGPYAGMKITGVTGISDAQKAALRALGAVEE